MNQKVLVLAGTKQSGKSTAAKFIHGHLMKKGGIITAFRIDQDDDLLITLPTGEECVLDIYREDDKFAAWARNSVWPYAKVYSFATELKETLIRVFSLNPDFVYGSDADKNTPTHIKWKDIWHLLPKERQKALASKKDGFLTHRELMQEFGTICRAFDPECWMRAAWSKLTDDGFPFCVIDDGRYENEVDYGNSRGAVVVRLTLQPFEDSHTSELIHKVPQSKFFTEIDNKNMTIDQKNDSIITLLDRIGL